MADKEIVSTEPFYPYPPNESGSGEYDDQARRNSSRRTSTSTSSPSPSAAANTQSNQAASSSSSSSQEKRYECPICFSKHSRIFNLNQHKKIHSGVRAFSCEFCQKRFTRSTDLTRHKKSVHEVDKDNRPLTSAYFRRPKDRPISNEVEGDEQHQRPSPKRTKRRSSPKDFIGNHSQPETSSSMSAAFPSSSRLQQSHPTVLPQAFATHQSSLAGSVPPLSPSFSTTSSSDNTTTTSSEIFHPSASLVPPLEANKVNSSRVPISQLHSSNDGFIEMLDEHSRAAPDRRISSLPSRNGGSHLNPHSPTTSRPSSRDSAQGSSSSSSSVLSSPQPQQAQAPLSGTSDQSRATIVLPLPRIALPKTHLSTFTSSASSPTWSHPYRPPSSSNSRPAMISPPIAETSSKIIQSCRPVPHNNRAHLPFDIKSTLTTSGFGISSSSCSKTGSSLSHH